MNAAIGRGVDRDLGRLEAGLEHVEGQLSEIKSLIESSDRRSSDFRQTVREQLTDINSKVDPIATKLDALDMTVKAHEVVLASYAKRDDERRGARAERDRIRKIRRWIVGTAVALGTGAATAWLDALRLIGWRQ